ncbi:MAG: hypothetical protein KAX49_18420 [Halanaerobiales bacterium]|nr:hypothetical protein [Halanaerobiales bacterium]
MKKVKIYILVTVLVIMTTFPVWATTQATEPQPINVPITTCDGPQPPDDEID